MKKSRLSHIGLIFVVLLCPSLASCMNSVTETQSAEPTQSDVLIATDTPTVAPPSPTTTPSPTASPTRTPTSTPTATQEIFNPADCESEMMVLYSEVIGGYQGLCLENGEVGSLEYNPEWYGPPHWVSEEELMQYLDPDEVLVRYADNKPFSITNSELDFVQTTRSPDGRFIAYSFVVLVGDTEPLGKKFYYGIEVVDTQTRRVSTGVLPLSPAPMLSFAEVHEDIIWAPVGNLVMLYSRALPIQVLKIDCNTDTGLCVGKIVPPVSGKWTGYSFLWSPDGMAIAYNCYDEYTVPPSDQNRHLCIQEITNENGATFTEYYPEELGLYEIDEVGWVRWSPDGTHLVFNAWESENGKKDVIVFSLADQTVINLTEDFYGDYAVVAWLDANR